MASDRRTVAHILDQARDAGEVTARKMFGEYAIYCDGLLVALVCDDQLYLKPTAGGRRHLDTIVEAPPYPGAKPHLVVAPELRDDSARLVQLVQITAKELPPPKPKKRC